MLLPFTREQFLDVFRSYNEAVGVAPLLLMAIAVAAVALAHSRLPWRHTLIPVLLAVLWLWSGIVYHIGFFSAINPAAAFFGAIFVVAAAVFLLFGVVGANWRFEPHHSGARGLAGILILYSLVIYPLLGWTFGHGYPNGPSFGAPCPITIFTLGIMLWGSGPHLRTALIIPVLWALIGTTAAFSLGIYEDFALGASALIVLYTMLRPARARSTPQLATPEQLP
jgi:hypothetical protein